MDLATNPPRRAVRVARGVLLAGLALALLLLFAAPPALAQNFNPESIPDEESMQGQPGEQAPEPGDQDGDGCHDSEWSNSPYSTGSTRKPCDDPNQAGAEENTDSNDQNPDELGATADEGCSVLGIDLCATAKSAARQILTATWEWMANTLDKVEGAVMDAAFDLPLIGESGGIVAKYNEMVDLVKPGLIVGVLILGVLMMVQSANYTSQYAALYGLPKIGFVALCLAFFPEFMEMVSGLSTGIAENLGDGSGPSGIGGALGSIMEKAYDVPGADSVFTVSPQLGVLIGALLMIPILVMLIFILMVSVIKNVLFGVLVVTGPLALIVYPLPGLSGITGAWFRAVTACFAVPLLFSVELAVGSWLVDAPEVLGAGDSAVMAAFLLIVLLFVMWKTPFKVLEWAFQGTYSPGGGMLSSIAKHMVTKSAVRGIEKGIGSAIGAFGSGKKGGEGYGKSKPSAPVGSHTDRKRPGSSAAGKSAANGRGAATGSSARSAAGFAVGAAGRAAVQDFDPAHDEHYGPTAGDTPGVRPSAAAEPEEVARAEYGAAESVSGGRAVARSDADSHQSPASAAHTGSFANAADDRGSIPSAARVAATVPTPSASEVGEGQAAGLGQTAHALSQAGEVSLPEHRQNAALAGRAAEAARNRADAASHGDHAAAERFAKQAAGHFDELKSSHEQLAGQQREVGNTARADLHQGAANAAGLAASEARQQASSSGAAQRATLATFFAAQGTDKGDASGGDSAIGSAGAAGSTPLAFADTMRAAGVGVGEANAALGSADRSALALNSRTGGTSGGELPSGMGGSVAGARTGAAQALQDAHSAISAGNFGQAGSAFESAARHFYTVSNTSAAAAEAAESAGHGEVARIHRHAQAANRLAGHQAQAGAQKVRSAGRPPKQNPVGAPRRQAEPGSGGESAIKISTAGDVRRMVSGAKPGGPSLPRDGNPFNGNPFDNIRAAEAHGGSKSGA